MNDDDAWQGMLFAGMAQETVEDSVADRVLRLCALNVNSPSVDRAHRLVDWLLVSGCNALVLSELRPGDGAAVILDSLDAAGFHVARTPGWRASRYFTAIATKGFTVSSVCPAPFDPRVVAVDLTSGAGTVRLVGVYSLTNGMSAESSWRRRTFQEQLITYLAGIGASGVLCVSGDLNVVEPGHQPPLDTYEPHDYDFYRALGALDLLDAYRTRQPAGTDHSWFSTRYGNQRLDHTLVSRLQGKIADCVYDQSTRDQGLSDHAAMRTVIEL